MMRERIEWEFESAPVREQIRLRNKGNVGPEKIKPFEREILDARPRDDETVSAVLNALDELGSCRPIAMSAIGRIPATAIWAWVDRRGYRGVAAKIIERGIIEADRTYVDEYVKKASET